MTLIDKYVYTTVRRLPEKMREEVEAELRANIAEMLPDNPSEEEVKEALKAMGNPVTLAERYRGEARYLIGPAVFEFYLLVLKIVLPVVCIALPFVTLMQILTGELEGEFVFGKMLSDIFSGGFSAFTWVTVIFAILERVKFQGKEWPYTGKEWTFDDLEQPKEPGKKRVGYADPVADIVFAVVGVLLVTVCAKYLGWYDKGADGYVITPLFNEARLAGYIPFVALSAAVTCAVRTAQLIWQKWTPLLTGLEIFRRAVSLCVFLFFVNDAALISADFLNAAAVAVPAETLARSISATAKGLSVLAVTGFVFEVIKHLKRAK